MSIVNLDAFLISIVCVFFALSSWTKPKSDLWSRGFFDIGWVLFSALIIRFFFWEPYQNQGESMNPTIPPASTLMLNKQAYGFQVPISHFVVWPSLPRRYDIIAIDRGPRTWVKRVVALPGDEIRVNADGWFINQQWMAPVSFHEWSAWLEHAGFPQNIYTQQSLYLRNIQQQVSQYQSWHMRIPSGFVFVMGDNTLNSIDSRHHGFVPLSQIRGRVDIIWPNNEREEENLLNSNTAIEIQPLDHYTGSANEI